MLITRTSFLAVSADSFPDMKKQKNKMMHKILSGAAAHARAGGVMRWHLQSMNGCCWMGSTQLSQVPFGLQDACPNTVPHWAPSSIPRKPMRRLVPATSHGEGCSFGCWLASQKCPGAMLVGITKGNPEETKN